MQHKPLQIGSHFCWYSRRGCDKAVTYDGAAEIKAHWLPPDLFDKLTGGEGFATMGIRRYDSEMAANAALDKAK